MALHIGIVGLPNVGKTTAFNALTKAQNAESANYPFSTVGLNKAVVTVPDPRVDRLVELEQPKKVVFASIEFVDIAGLAKGASQGEGLGNQFLGHIRQTSAVVHVVRCFDDDNVAHVSDKLSPRDDIDTINTELIFADLEQLERKIGRLEKQVKGDKGIARVIQTAEKLKAHLEEGKPASSFPDRESDIFQELNNEMQFITDKTVIFVANVDEAGLAEENDYAREVRAIAEEHGEEVVTLCAKIEEEMAGISDEERLEFLQSMGAEESGLDQIIHKGFRALGLISFFTAGPKEVHAWTIPAGWTAPQAAGAIHSDIERGFIRAEVIPFDTYSEYETEVAVKAAGAMRVEGKDYCVKDGDVIYFRFNV